MVWCLIKHRLSSWHGTQLSTRITSPFYLKKDSSYEELHHLFNQFPMYHMKILLVQK